MFFPTKSTAKGSFGQNLLG